MSLPPENGSSQDRDLTAALLLVEQLQPAIEQRDRAKLIEVIRRLIELRAPMGKQWRALALLSANGGELGLAKKAIDLFAETFGSGSESDYRKAALLFDLGFSHEADVLLRSLPENLPDPVSNAYSRAAAAISLGRTEEARLCLERVTAARPQLGSAWLALSPLINFGDETDCADRLISAERLLENAPRNERAFYYYALGKAYADRSEYSLAFSAFARGAWQMKALLKFDRDADRDQAAEAVRDYSPERISGIAGRQKAPTGRTIFVTGLPRSGTTLVEQILTSHSGVAGGAEIDTLSLLANEIGGTAFPALARGVDAFGIEPLTSLWDHWLDERFPGTGRIVNKALDTSRYVGIAAALLPEAPLIWITRNPLDRAWSCFRTNFLGNSQPWSYDLEDIAAHFRIEDGLLAEWKDILGGRLLVVPYEELVSHPATWIRRILTHCGLQEEPQVFAPHQNRRAVETASMMQVRRPINRDAIGSAEPYREFLQPFIDAYYG